MQRHARIERRLATLFGAERGREVLPRLLERVARWAPRVPAPGRPLDERDVVLIAYPDHLAAPGEAPLRTLERFLSRHLAGLVSLVHVLPFHPSTSYEGYAVTDYLGVDPALGTDADLARLAARVGLMTDLVLNHCSASHPWFHQFRRGEEPGRRYFVVVEDPEAPWLKAVARARDLPLVYPVQTPAGEKHVWATYSPDLVDLNWREPGVLLELTDALLDAVCRGARLVRLDAFVYVWKEAGTSCVDRPEGHELLRLFQDLLEEAGASATLLLPSITNVSQAQNEHYLGAGAVEREADLVYHLPLASLVLHALLRGDASALRDWLARQPPAPAGRARYHVTATHDGIGLSWLAGVLPPPELDALVAEVRAHGGLLSSRRPTAEGEPRPWELNATWWSACGPGPGGDDDAQVRRVLVTQAAALALRGVPALYLPTVLGAENDHARAEAWADPRAINRARFELDPWERAAAQPSSPQARLLAGLQALLAARTRTPAFHPEAGQEVLPTRARAVLALRRTPLDGGPRVWCLMNFAPLPQRVAREEVDAPVALVDLLHGGTAAWPQQLEPYAVQWLAEASAEREGFVAEPTSHRGRAIRLRAAEPGAGLESAPGHQVLHLLRHGEAAHQRAAAEGARAGVTCRCHEPGLDARARAACPYLDDALLDDALTERGWRQTRGQATGQGVELVLAACARRSLETALSALEGERLPPVLALDELRPRAGPHRHSRRAPRATLAAAFPAVDFSRVRDELDPLWSPLEEPRARLDGRLQAFLRLLRGRPERRVLLVTHFTVLLALTQAGDDVTLLGANPGRPPGDGPWLDFGPARAPAALARWLECGELRTLVVVAQEAP